MQNLVKQIKIIQKDFQDNEGRVQQFFRENYNIHLINEYFFEKGKHETFEDFSYYEGYLPLWQEWAKQNTELIEKYTKGVTGTTEAQKAAEINSNTLSNRWKEFKNTLTTLAYNTIVYFCCFHVYC